MANKNLFKGKTKSLPRATTVNNAGGSAYELSAEDSLGKILCTGCLSNTFYQSAEDQLATVLDLASRVSPEFLAKAAIYSRFSGVMKDMPAILVAYLATTDIDSDTFRRVFNKVINNGKMLSNYIQIMLSGQINGRKCLGTRSKKAVAQWLENREPVALFNDSIGNSPSIVDAIKLSHPRSNVKTQDIIFKYLMGFDLNKTQMRSLPKEIRDYESWKLGESKSVPSVRFEMLTAQPLTMHEWADIAAGMGYKALIKNLNTLQRNGVFGSPNYLTAVANRIKDKDSVLDSKIFPYELLAAYTFGVDLPSQIRLALQDAMDIATANTPTFDQDILICLDISGSMSGAITGNRGATVASKMRNIEVASLFAASLIRKNPSANLIVFNDKARVHNFNPRDSVVRNTTDLVALLSGGTNCETAIALANKNGSKAPLVIMISDNQSLAQMNEPVRDISIYSPSQIKSLGLDEQTGAMTEWARYLKRVPNAKLINLDISPNITSQLPSRPDIFNIGGWSNNIFNIVQEFLSSGKNSFSWSRKIAAIKL